MKNIAMITLLLCLTATIGFSIFTIFQNQSNATKSEEEPKQYSSIISLSSQQEASATNQKTEKEINSATNVSSTNSISSVETLEINITSTASSSSQGSSNSSVTSQSSIDNKKVTIKVKENLVYDKCVSSENDIEINYTEKSCFRLKFDNPTLFKPNIQSENTNLVNNSNENKDALREISMDYYTQIEDKLKSKNNPVVISNSVKKADLQYEFDLSINQSCKSKYLLFASGGEWNFKKISLDTNNCS
jgi:hypothetical protein